MTSLDELEVCEVFRSLSGESLAAGLPATFLRLAGCNLHCQWCDTRYAAEPGERRSGAEVLAALRDAPPGDLIVVTGGEPLLQPRVLPLLADLVAQGRQVVLETNGSVDIGPVDPGVIRVVDVKCPASGEVEANRWENLTLLRPTDEVKFVVADRADFDFALAVIARHRLAGRATLLVSPVQGELPPAELARWILDSPRVGPLRLQLQLHRILWPDRERGV